MTKKKNKGLYYNNKLNTNWNNYNNICFDPYFNNYYNPYFNNYYNPYFNNYYNPYFNNYYNPYFNNYNDTYFNNYYDPYFNNYYDPYFNNYYDPYFNGLNEQPINNLTLNDSTNYLNEQSTNILDLSGLYDSTNFLNNQSNNNLDLNGLHESNNNTNNCDLKNNLQFNLNKGNMNPNDESNDDNINNSWDNDLDEHNYDFKNSRLNKYIKFKKPKTYMELEIKANSLRDLIDITDRYKLDDEHYYNINLEGLYNIKDDLIELNDLIGLEKIKKSIFEQLIYFIQNLHTSNIKNDGDFKHTVIYGPPGTGKTLIAKILGKLYSKIGILKKNYFKIVTRSDLIAGYLGQTAIKTKKVINEALGGVLFIDEAYSLGGENSDNYSKECIDTLCHELSENKEDLMVIIAGYEDELNEYFFSKNKGLDSRFIWRFEIDSYSYIELMKIFQKKINDIGWELIEVKENWFKKNISYFTNYGRDMETLLLKTKIAHSKRVFGKPDLIKKITLEDLNKGFDLFKDNAEVKKRNERKEIPGLYV